MKKPIFVFFIAILLTSVANAQYASLSIDQKAGDQYGWAINYETQEEADRRALAECEKNGGDDCHIVLRFQGGCGVYVVEKGNNGLYGWGTADTKEAAQAKAMKEARAVGGTDLIVRVWGCNDGGFIASENVEIPIKGVYYFYYTYSEYWNRSFVSEVLFQPGVAQKQGEKWVWTADAEEKMTPGADRFMDQVEENLYGFLGENKDKAYTRTELDWRGMNEVDYNNSALDLYRDERRKRLEKGIESVEELSAERQAELIRVNVGG